MSTQKQTSIWNFTKSIPPPDQLLVIGHNPKLNQWIEIPYVFEQPYTQFAFTEFKIPILGSNTRCFLGSNPWNTSTNFFTPEPSQKGEMLIPYLKSQLQKTIRRNLAFKACQTAWFLLKQDPLELLRRLPIIMIEDKFAHEDLALVVWGMLHLTKNSQWAIPVDFVNRIMSLVWDIASAPYYHEPRIAPDMAPKDLNKLPPFEKGIAIALCVRADYGGTGGDVNLLIEGACSLNTTKIVQSTFEMPQYPFPDTSMDNHWIPATFDFHVTDLIPWLCVHVPNLDSVIAKYDPHVTPLQYAELLTKVVWIFYSSIRYCAQCGSLGCGVLTEQNHPLIPIWVAINAYVHAYSSDRLAVICDNKRKLKHEENSREVISRSE